MMENRLILEGGGLRCFYTMGILETFLEEGIAIPNVTGVSAGAISGALYVSGQRGIAEALLKKMRYIPGQMRLYLWVKKAMEKTGRMDIRVFLSLIKKWFPYDFEAYANSLNELKVGCFNIETGETKFFGKSEQMDNNVFWNQIAASASLPFESPIVTIGDKKYMDGGIDYPLPKLDYDGFKNVLVFTRDLNYRKEKSEYTDEQNLELSKYPKLKEAVEERHIHYNEMKEEFLEKEKKGSVFIFKPEFPINIGIFHTHASELTMLYEAGINDAKKRLNELKEFLAE